MNAYQTQQPQQTVLKVSLGSDIRRIPLHNEDLTYDDLILMMQRVFSGQVKASDDIVVKYQDEDGDWISLLDSADLLHGMQGRRVLKLRLSVAGDGAVSGGVDSGAVDDIRTELKQVCSAVTDLLGKLEKVVVASHISSSSSGRVSDKSAATTAKSTSNATPAPTTKNTAKPAHDTSGFDPLASIPASASTSRVAASGGAERQNSVGSTTSSVASSSAVSTAPKVSAPLPSGYRPPNLAQSQPQQQVPPPASYGAPPTTAVSAATPKYSAPPTASYTPPASTYTTTSTAPQTSNYPTTASTTPTYGSSTYSAAGAPPTTASTYSQRPPATTAAPPQQQQQPWQPPASQQPPPQQHQQYYQQQQTGAPPTQGYYQR